MTDSNISPSQFTWLRLARLLALAFMLFCLLVFFAGVFYYRGYAETHPERFTTWGWTPQEMNTIFGRIGLSFAWWIQFILMMTILFSFSLCGIGFFIYLRKKDDWFSLYIATAFILFGTFTGYPVSVLANTRPEWEPILRPLSVLAWVVLFLIFYLFPDGNFAPSWTRWAAAFLFAAFLVDILIYSGASPPPPLMLLIFIGIAIGLGSQVYRYRRVSDALQRQQTKWVVFAFLIVFFLLLITSMPLMNPGLRDPDSSLALMWTILSSSATLVMLLIPLSIAFAILRYRLWDINVIIRRTLVYGALTAILALVYFGMVTLLQNLFSAVSGQQSTVAVVLSTLAIATLFTPLRRRIQDAIDRRFYRRKYDAQKALESFAVDIRDVLELEQISAYLLAVVQETVQPQMVSLWLSETDDGVRRTDWADRRQNPVEGGK